MDSEARFPLDHAEHEILLADVLKKLSEKTDAKELLGVPTTTTFYNSVISHAYYAIFYAVNALLVFN